jgi:hypothetical protein
LSFEDVQGSGCVTVTTSPLIIVITLHYITP